MKKLIAVLTLLILSTSSFAQLDQFTKFALEQAEVKESVSISAKPYTFTNGYFKGETADRKIVQYRLFIPLYSKGGRSMYDEKERIKLELVLRLKCESLSDGELPITLNILEFKKSTFETYQKYIQAKCIVNKFIHG